MDQSSNTSCKPAKAVPKVKVEVKALAARVLGSYALQPIEGQVLVHAGHWTAVLLCGKWLRVKAQT